MPTTMIPIITIFQSIIFGKKKAQQFLKFVSVIENIAPLVKTTE